MPDNRQPFTYSPASTFTDRHAVIVALVAPPNAGKTYSGMRMARGMAEAQGKRFAVLDTEGGRTLHLRKDFDFDFTLLDAPHRPSRYVEAVRAAEAAGYGALLIDSFTMEWRGMGGVLSWMDEELEAYVERQKAYAAQYNRNFDESKTRNAGKSAASIRPKVAHKEMMFGLLGVRMPIILSVRGENTYDPDSKAEIFKPQCQKGLLFEVTVSFRLASDKKGVVDLSDATTWKMEGSHAAMFKHGDQLNEEHGKLLNAWATNAPLPGQVDKATALTDALIALVDAADTEEVIAQKLMDDTHAKQIAWLKAKRPELHTKLNDAITAKRGAMAGGLPL
jgi:hypothetical protein